MSDTLDLLDTIGRTASLRHASTRELERTLAGMHASQALRQSVLSGETGHLKRELGPKDSQVITNPPPPPPPPPPGKDLPPPPPPRKA